MEPITSMKTIIYLFCLLISSTFFLNISTCRSPVNQDKEITELTPDDSIKIIKKEMLYTIAKAEKKVNLNEIEIKQVDTLLAKQQKRKPILRPIPKPKVEQKHNWFQDIFTKKKKD